MNGLIIALAANTVNLLDVRPGRALKWWGLAILIPLIVPSTMPVVLPLAVAAVVYSPLDFQRMGMLGDTGALALGASAGFAWCMILPDHALGATLRWVILLGLVTVNVYAELGSLSKVISQCPILEYLDNLWVSPRARRGAERLY